MILTADDILGMTRRDAMSRFASDGEKEISALIKVWHPDICDHTKSTDVFRHLLSLRRSLRGPDTARQRILMTDDGRRLGVSPLSTLQADQGEIIVNRNTLATIFPPTFHRLALQEVEAIESFTFANADMERQMASTLPKLLRVETLTDGSTVVIVKKGPQDILLADLLRARGQMPDVHAAWLCSGLMNTAAWLSYAGIMHGAISAEHILINPKRHTVRLVAGWGFATRIGTRPAALPGRTLNLAPRLSRRDEMADTIVDRELVRQIMRDALGDPHGTNGGVSSLPALIAAWINLPPAEDAVADYAGWQKALESDWGPRCFVKYPVAAKDIYENI